MKTRKQISVIAIAIITLGIIALAIIGCKQDDPPPQEQAKVQPDTPRTLAFGTDCEVTIKSEDKFTDAEWKTLCDKAVVAIARGYGAAPGVAQKAITNYFTNNTVSVVLSKSATLDCEVKVSVPNTMYLKADGSAIDGISDTDIRSVIVAIVGGSSYPTP